MHQRHFLQISHKQLHFEGKSTATTVLAIIGKAGVAAAFTGIYIYTSELFPTEVRNMALGISSTAGRVGGLIAPYAGGSLVRILN